MSLLKSKAQKITVKDDSTTQTVETSGAQADEAKAMLAKMEAKKEAGDCPFC